MCNCTVHTFITLLGSTLHCKWTSTSIQYYAIEHTENYLPRETTHSICTAGQPDTVLYKSIPSLQRAQDLPGENRSWNRTACREPQTPAITPQTASFTWQVLLNSYAMQTAIMSQFVIDILLTITNQTMQSRTCMPGSSICNSRSAAMQAHHPLCSAVMHIFLCHSYLPNTQWCRTCIPSTQMYDTYLMITNICKCRTWISVDVF